MNNIIFAIFISFVNNVDNISARVAFSVKGIYISNRVNLLISLITLILTGAATFLGQMATGFFDQTISSFISMLLFVGMGVWIVLDTLLKVDKKKARKNQLLKVIESPEEADTNDSKDIDLVEAIVLGVALSINNISGGFAAGMMGLNFILVGVSSAVFNYIALWAGNYLTEIIVKLKLGMKATFVSGILLIAFGVCQLFI